MQLVDIDLAESPDATALLASVAGSMLGATRLAANGRVRGVDGDGGLVACVVTSTADDGALVIDAIAVAPEQRRRGIGRAVVELLRADDERLVAEAAEETVGFFRRCGFDIRSAGGTPYQRRYVCELG